MGFEGVGVRELKQILSTKYVWRGKEELHLSRNMCGGEKLPVRKLKKNEWSEPHGESHPNVKNKEVSSIFLRTEKF
jgi:hypothetical protein